MSSLFVSLSYGWPRFVHRQEHAPRTKVGRAMKCVMVVLAALALLLGGVGQAKAGFIGIAGVQGVIFTDPENTPFGAGPISGVPTLSTPVTAIAQDTVNGASGFGQATVQFVPPPGLSEGFTWQLTATAQASGSKVTTQAIWQDVLTLSNTNPLLVGHTLRLNFMSTGFLTHPSNPGGAVLTGVGNAYGENSPTFTGTGAKVAAEAVDDGDGLQTTGKWDSFQPLGGGGYMGFWHLDIPIAPANGNSFFYQVTDTAQAYGGGGTYTAADPSSFLSITLPDVGNVTPESLGVGVTFDSGIVSPNVQPSVVPEPSTLTLLGIGAFGMMGYAWRRRKQVET